MQETQNTQTDQSELTDSSKADSADAVKEQATEPARAVQPSVEDLLKTAEQKAAESHDAWLRAKADAENIRKRAQTDVINAHKYAVENLLNDLLPVLDSLEAALMIKNTSVENFKSGMELTHKQFTSVFEKSNIAVIDPKGEKFDPYQHQAISTVKSEQAPNTVVEVMQKGYKLNDRIIRPALVSVSKTKEA